MKYLSLNALSAEQCVKKMVNPVVITLDNTERNRALEYQAEVLKNVRGPNYTGLDVPGRYFVGWCAERALDIWADLEGLEHKWEPRADGRSDDGDFKFYRRGRTYSADIKGSHNPMADKLLLSVDQKERGVYDIYVGSNGTDHKDHVDVALWGVISGKNLIKSDLITLRLTNHYCPLAKLLRDNPMSSFAEWLRG